MYKKYLALLAVCLVSPIAQAEIGMGLRGGTMGFGADVDMGMTEKLNLRLGYNFLNYDYEIEDTDVTYDGELEIESFSALLDWHAFGGSFRFTVGAYSSGPSIVLNGTPAPGTTVEIGDSVYNANQLGSLRGEIEFGDSVSPYVGIGFGNVLDKDGRVSFLFDVGLMFSGSAEVELTPVCGPAAPEGSATCNNIKRDVQEEIDELENDSSDFDIYPVISFGIGIRF